MSLNSRLKAIQIIGERKAFYRQRIPDSSCARKETVDILVTSKRYRAISGERNFIERNKTSIFLETVLAIEIMYEPQSNSEEKVNPNFLKDDFSSRTDPSIFTSIALVLLD